MAISLRDKAKQERQEKIFIKPGTLHPGFPKIDVMEKLKNANENSIKQEVNMAVKDIGMMANKYEGVNGAALRKDANNIIKKNKQQPMMGMAAYFDTTEMKSGVKALDKIIREKMQIAMMKGSREATFNVASQIKTMRREYKSKYIPNKAVDGDLYHTIGDSLKVHDMQESRQPNQFISLRVGSYDEGDEETNPTGVRGSRMKKTDPSLVELTDRGITPFVIKSPIAGTKRIKRLLKGRNIAGVRRK